MRIRDEKGGRYVTLLFFTELTSQSPSKKRVYDFLCGYLTDYTERVRQTQTLTKKVFANSSPGFALKAWGKGGPKLSTTLKGLRRIFERARYPGFQSKPWAGIREHLRC